MVLIIFDYDNNNDNNNPIVILPGKFIKYVDEQNCIQSNVNNENNNNNDNNKQYNDNNDSDDKIDNNAAIATIMKINKMNNDRFSTNLQFTFMFDNSGVSGSL